METSATKMLKVEKLKVVCQKLVRCEYAFMLHCVFHCFPCTGKGTQAQTARELVSRMVPVGKPTASLLNLPCLSGAAEREAKGQKG